MPRLHDALLALIVLMKLDGSPLWVESSQVFIVQQSRDCAHERATTIMVSGKAFCVKETIDEVREKIKQGNQLPW